MKFFLHKKSIRVISLIIFSSITFSLYSLSITLSLYPLRFSFGNVSYQENTSNQSQKLEEALDVLRVEQILESLPFLFDQDSLISDNEWQELEIDLVLKNWEKYQKTKFDLWGIKKLLKFAPQGSKEVIRYLVENGQAYEALDNFFDLVQDSQDALIGYWDEKNMLHDKLKSFYYSGCGEKTNKFLNNNTASLEFSQFLNVVSPIASILAGLGIAGLMQGCTTARLMGVPFNWKKSILYQLKRPFVTHDPRPHIYKNGYDLKKMYEYQQNGTLGDNYIVSKYILKAFFKKFTSNNMVQNVLAGFTGALSQVGGLALFDYLQYRGLKNSMGEISFLYKTITPLQHNMVKIAKMFKALDKLEPLDLQAYVAVLQNIEKYLTTENEPEEFKKLLELLETGTFEDKASWWFSRGRVLNAHGRLTKMKNELTPLLQSIALLGGYRAIVQMVREHQDMSMPVRYCFVEFVESDTLVVSMKNAWVPLLKEDAVIANDVQLGGAGNASNAIITGPNGGGKSTFMMTVAFNVLLSRLGIAAADKVQMSNFARIRTSVHSQQNIASGLSSFMAEHKRVKEVKKAIDACEGNILILLDEPYKGTIEAESALRVYEFGKELAENNNCMILMATHLRKPIELEDDMPTLFANYQMGYIEAKNISSSGSCGAVRFKRTFKILDGPAMWWFDDADRRARFINWLCEQEIQEGDQEE